MISEKIDELIMDMKISENTVKLRKVLFIFEQNYRRQR